MFKIIASLVICNTITFNILALKKITRNTLYEHYLQMFANLLRPDVILSGENVSKRFFSETTWTVETKLPRNDHWKVLYKVSVFYADRKSKMAATTGHSINTGP